MTIDMVIFLQEGIEFINLANRRQRPFFQTIKDSELKLKLDDQKEIDSFAVVNVEINDGDDEYPDFEDSDSDAEGCAHFGTFHEELTWFQSTSNSIIKFPSSQKLPSNFLLVAN